MLEPEITKKIDQNVLICIYGFVGKICLWKKFLRFESPTRGAKQPITVSVFLSTLQLTALLLNSFRLRLHCYTLPGASYPPEQVFQICTD